MHRNLERVGEARQHIDRHVYRAAFHFAKKLGAEIGLLRQFFLRQGGTLA